MKPFVQSYKIPMWENQNPGHVGQCLPSFFPCAMCPGHDGPSSFNTGGNGAQKDTVPSPNRTPNSCQIWD